MADADTDNFLLNRLNYDNPICNYYFLNSNDNELNNLPNNFSLVCHNIICSLHLHFDEFIDQCLTPLHHSFDVIGFCESKLTQDIETLYNIPNYTMYTNNVSRHSGGVVLYIKKQPHDL